MEAEEGLVDDEEETVNVNPNNGRVVVANKRDMDSPPLDDCCSICFDSFNLPSRTDCGHWFCAGCILQYWTYSAGILQRCKCPICFELIGMLTPEASLTLQREEEVVKVLKNVQRYNRLFAGGVYGLIGKLLNFQLVFKRFFQGLMDPDRVDFNFSFMQWIAIFLNFIYVVYNLDFIPLGHTGVEVLFNCGAFALAFIPCWVGIYRRWRLTQRVRLLAAPPL